MITRRPLILILSALATTPAWAARAPEPDEPGVTRRAPGAERPNPRLKLAYRRFAIPNLDGTSVWLDGGELDVYFLSRRFVRAGFELHGGGGAASLEQKSAGLSYGLLGIVAGFQYPARLTPFLEGRFAAGLLAGRLDSALSVAGVTVSQASALTYLYQGGIDAGVEIYTVGRLYVSIALGWVRATWRGIDYPALLRAPEAGVTLKELRGDSFTLKVGLGI